MKSRSAPCRLKTGCFSSFTSNMRSPAFLSKSSSASAGNLYFFLWGVPGLISHLIIVFYFSFIGPLIESLNTRFLWTNMFLEVPLYSSSRVTFKGWQTSLIFGGLFFLPRNVVMNYWEVFYSRLSIIMPVSSYFFLRTGSQRTSLAVYTYSYSINSSGCNGTNYGNLEIFSS